MLCICRKNLHCILKKYGWDDANFDIELKTTLFRGNNLNILIFDFSYIFSSSKVQSPQRVCFWFYTHQVHLCAFFRHWINLAKLSTENTNYMDFSKLYMDLLIDVFHQINLAKLSSENPNLSDIMNLKCIVYFSSDLRFVKKFTRPDFRTKNFTH